MVILTQINSLAAELAPGSSSATNNEENRALQKMLVKGGAVVDPESGLDHCATVATDADGRLLTAVLGLVDFVRGSNSYYKYVYTSHTTYYLSAVFILSNFPG